MGEKNFERAEILMFDEAVRASLNEARPLVGDAQLLISGDLLNQMTTSSYVARNLDLPHLGVYSACSTYTEALSIGSVMLDGGYFDTVACATVSHFATAERQFRYPLEYGCQRPPYAQWTVTAAGCCVISTKGNGPVIKSATLGKVIDFGQNDLSNMGAAMAPAALSTLTTLFKETQTSRFGKTRLGYFARPHARGRLLSRTTVFRLRLSCLQRRPKLLSRRKRRRMQRVGNKRIRIAANACGRL